LEDLDNERLKLKTLIESLIQREEARANMNVEEEDMIHIPWRYMPPINHNECGPHVVMLFNLHGVKEFFGSREVL